MEDWQEITVCCLLNGIDTNGFGWSRKLFLLFKTFITIIPREMYYRPYVYSPTASLFTCDFCTSPYQLTRFQLPSRGPSAIAELLETFVCKLKDFSRPQAWVTLYIENHSCSVRQGRNKIDENRVFSQRIKIARSSAVEERPRDALCQWKSCHLLQNCTKNHIWKGLL